MDGSTLTAPDPLVSLHQVWLASRRKWLDLSMLPSNENGDDPRFLEAQDRMLAIENQMLELTPTSLAGIEALAVLGWTFLAPITGDTEELEGDQKAMLAIWRACSGKDGVPID